MKLFRDRVLITDEDYDLIMQIPEGRKFTTEEAAALHRAINAYYFSYQDEYIGLKFAAGFFVYSLVCIGIGFLIGYWL